MNNEFNKEATDLLHKQIFVELQEIKADGKETKRQTTETNGKVRRLFIYLTAVASFALGLGIVEAKTLLTFLI